MKWEEIERIEKLGGRDGVKDKKGARKRSTRPVQMQVGGYVKGPGGARSTPLDVWSGSSIIVAFCCFMLSFFPGLQCLTR
ncbi:hypothetical protein BDW60DRAFT_67605 [Aspergillus nidulans var. acristatus]